MLKLTLLAAAAMAAGAASIPPSDQPHPAAAGEQLDFEHDMAGRMTVPVSINGTGPYRFVVDTGAERTVISEELAEELRLGEGDRARMHSMTEVQMVDTVLIQRLGVSRKTVEDIHAPALAERNLGADGMLGVDSLQSQRVLFDFERQTMWVSPSRVRIPDAPKFDRDTIVVKARSKFGRLILADAQVNGEKVWVVIDTGSQVTIGNEALRRKLVRSDKLQWMAPIDLISVTGGRLRADYGQVAELKVGSIELANLPIAFADVHPFRKLGLLRRPALLLGMDSLALFERVSIDFASRKIRFDLPDLSFRSRRTQLAFSESAKAAVAPRKLQK